MATQESKDPKILWITESQLPISCPTAEMSLWNSHPRVYLPLAEKGSATCPYCGTTFSLKGKHGAP